MPVKGSHVAALAIGWLAVALGSAVLGSASIARLGFGTAQPQSQITVMRVGSPMRAFPTGEGVTDFVGVDAAGPGGRTVSVIPYLKPSVRTTASPAPVATAAPAAAAPSDITAPIGDAPLLPPTSSGSGPTLGLAPTASPTPSSTAPGKGSTKKPPNNKSTPTPVPTLLVAQ
ncbi:MAG TPA: hypothetical protein VLS51_00440 [Propionibacteriaceae bacterium]|nr:hypothetical protein [Propionibacteriaceae bacterium]